MRLRKVLRWTAALAVVTTLAMGLAFRKQLGALYDGYYLSRQLVAAFDDATFDEQDLARFEALLAPVPPSLRSELQSGLRDLALGKGGTASKVFTATSQIPVLLLVPKGEGPFPAVVFLHGAGGAGLFGKETAVPHLAAMLSRGYLLAAMDARHFGERGGPHHLVWIGKDLIFPDVVLPTAYEDVPEVLEMLASLEEVDPTRIGIMGYSMGAVITLGAVATDPQGRVAAAAAIAGGADYQTTLNANRERDPAADELPQRTLKAISSLDPIHHLEAFHPRPLLLLHGKRDQTAPVEGIQSFYNALQPSYADHPDLLTLHIVDAGHELHAKWVWDVFDWFDLHLRPAQ